MWLTGRRVVVTGGAGFVGRRVVEHLLARGVEVVVVGRRPRPEWSPIYHRCDLTDAAQVEALDAGLGPVDCVVHLATLLPDAANAADYTAHTTHNFFATVNVLRLVSSMTRQVVYASTLDVYGPLQVLPADETHPTVPTTFYGAAKLASEHYLQVACARRGVPLAVLRLSQVYGPGEPEIKVIPRFIRQLVRGEPITLQRGGRDTRDYVYVDDAAEAFAWAIDRTAAGTFNIAAGREVSVREVLDTLVQIHGREPTVVDEPGHGTGTRSWFNVEAATRRLGFTANTPLRRGLEAQYLHVRSQAGKGAAA